MTEADWRMKAMADFFGAKFVRVDEDGEPMATNDATARDAIARAMTSGFSRRVWDGKFNPSTDPAYNKITRDHVCADFLADADAVIAHLWQAADDWDDVQLKVAMMLEGEVKCDVAPDSYHAKLEEMTSEIVTTLLTALIGPRPQGDER